MAIGGLRRSDGFSLIELAIVLVVIGLLIGGGLVALQVATERQSRTEQERQLADVRDALYGYVVAEGRLPCPADRDDPDGESATTGSDCTDSTGALPWVELGVGQRDAWGDHLLYHVHDRFAAPLPPDGEDGVVFDLTTQTDNADEIMVVDLDGAPVSRRAVAVVVSFAGQGGQVWTDAGFNCPGFDGPADGFSTEETDNCNRDSDFVAGGYRDVDHEDGRFDDLVIWLPDVILKSRMVEAQRLPEMDP